MQIDLYIGNDKLEVFGNENITLTSSVTDINDITKNFTDITKSFTVPASDINNAIFKHYYNANIDNTFDARTKVEGRIELNGMTFRYGKYRLEKVSVKNGQPNVYTIQFWGKGINLKDIIGTDELSSLDFSALAHEYNSTFVKDGLIGGLFNDDVVYSMLAKKQYYYNSTGNDPQQTDIISNIAYTSGGLSGVTWSDLKPSIKLIKIIEAIEVKYGIVFSRDFFDRQEFKQLYLYVNNSAKDATLSNEKKIDFTSGTNPYLDFATDTATYVRNNYGGLVKMIGNALTITPAPGFQNTEYMVRLYVNGQVVLENTYIGTSPAINYGFNNTGTYNMYYTISTNFSFSYNASYLATITNWSNYTVNYTVLGTGNTITSNALASANFPKIKTMDFLRGLFSMFKLIIKIQDDDLIYVNPITDYYAQGKLYDISNYTDSDNYEVERGKLLNPINFKFEEPTTLLNTQFDDNTGLPYGDEELILEDVDGNKLDGESFEIKLPFEQLVYERLNDSYDSVNTNVMYGGVFNDKIEAVNPKPHIFYNQNISLGAKTVGFINSVGAKEQLNTINVPSHTMGFTNPQFSTVWASEFNEWDGGLIENTLYSNYYSDYITSVFNIKKRSFKFDAVLPLKIQLELDLNDVIKIKEDYYRIENYNFNLLNGKTELNLINSFDNTINAFVSNRSRISVDFEKQTESAYVTNGGNFSFNKVDYGDGTDWIKESSVDSNVYFVFSQNKTGQFRTMACEIQDTVTLETISIILNQDATSLVTFDNVVITFDNTNITFDNQ